MIAIAALCGASSVRMRPVPAPDQFKATASRRRSSRGSSRSERPRGGDCLTLVLPRAWRGRTSDWARRRTSGRVPHNAVPPGFRDGAALSLNCGRCGLVYPQNASRQPWWGLSGGRWRGVNPDSQGPGTSVRRSESGRLGRCRRRIAPQHAAVDAEFSFDLLRHAAAGPPPPARIRTCPNSLPRRQVHHLDRTRRFLWEGQTGPRPAGMALESSRTLASRCASHRNRKAAPDPRAPILTVQPTPTSPNRILGLPPYWPPLASAPSLASFALATRPACWEISDWSRPACTRSVSTRRRLLSLCFGLAALREIPARSRGPSRPAHSTEVRGRVYGRGSPWPAPRRR